MPRGLNPNSKANLKPHLTTERAKELSKLAVEARRRNREQRKNMKQTLMVLLSKSLKRGEKVDAEDIQDLAEAENLNVDVMTAMNIAVIQRALLGDVQAIQFVRDTIGEKPSDKVEVDQSLTIESWAKEHKVKL